MRHNVRDSKGRFCKAPKTAELKVSGFIAGSINATIYFEEVVRAINKGLHKGLLEAINAKFEEGYDVVVISHQSLYDSIVKPLIKNELPFVSKGCLKKMRKLYLDCMPKVMLNYDLLVTVKENKLHITKMPVWSKYL